VNDFSSTLTLTGALATVLSLFFAFAAFFVQRKGKQASNRKHAKKEATNDVLDAHHVPRLPPVDKLINPDASSAPVVDADPAPLQETEDPVSVEPESMAPRPSSPPPAPAGNFFKKYTPAGGDQDVIKHATDSEAYSWE